MRTRWVLIVTAVASVLSLTAQQPLNKPRVGLHDWASGLPLAVCLANCGDSRMFVVQKNGVVRIVTDSMVVADRPFLDITDRVDAAGNEQGLLGMAFEPGYAESGYFYLYYIFGTGAGTSRISRFQVTADPDSADAGSEQIIYQWPQPEWNHNGGTLCFGPDGYLYMAFGDGGGSNDTYNNGQDLTDPLGDVIRIDVSAHDDSFLVPADNPWVDQDGSDTLPEIWMSGLRNPFRWSFDRLTGDVWIGDVGQVTWEEVDFWPAGDNSGPNFGWRCREAFSTNVQTDQTFCEDSAAYRSPIAAFDHVPENQGGQGWCSIMGGYVYRGATYPHLYGHYVFTDYCAGDFLTFGNGEGHDVDTLLMTQTAGWSGFGEDASGELYAVNVNSGEVKKLYDPCPMTDPVILDQGDQLVATEGLAYQWYQDGALIPDATEQNYLPSVSGAYQVVVDFGAPCSLISDTVLFSPLGTLTSMAPGWTVFPVPAREKVFVQRPAMVATDGAHILDALGRLVFTAAWPVAADRFELDLSSLANGNYTLLCSSAGKVVARAHLLIAR